LYQSTYYIEKQSQTFADPLAAFGLAFILNVVADGRAKIVLEDAGYAYAIHCDPEIQEEWINEATFFAGLPFLITVDSKSQKKMVKGTDILLDDLPIGGDVVVDYEMEKENNASFFEWRKSLSKDEADQYRKGLLRPPITPHPDWDLFRAVNPAALQVYNSLAGEWWRGREVFSEILRILLCLTAQVPNDVAAAEQAWDALCKQQGWPKPKRASASQLFNPAQGKGTNASKTVWSSPGNLSSFWMLEYLKVVGLRYGGFTRLVRGRKDRKTYVLAPARLDWTTHDQIMAKFRQRMLGSSSAIQMDILASLRYTQALIDHLEGVKQEDWVIEFLGHPATNLVHGMLTAFYKDMGNAIATMNIAALNLPGWVKAQTPDDFKQLQDALAEHEQIIRMLDESHSGEYELLKYYRDFLSGNELTPFFRFITAYSSFLMRQMDRKLPSRPFTTKTMEVLFMNSDDRRKTYSQIVQNPGFRNIAYAIRHSTVVPQGRKARGNRPAVDIRYGLGQQLARKAAYADDFLAEIASFVYKYNAENAQLRENRREVFRKNVTTEDLEALTALVDEFGSKVVSNLLIAFGYAREPYTGGEDNGPDQVELEPVNTDEDAFEE